MYLKKSADLIVLLRDFFFPQRNVSAADCVGMVLGVGGQTDARMRPHGTGETANHRPYRKSLAMRLFVGVTITYSSWKICSAPSVRASSEKMENLQMSK